MSNNLRSALIGICFAVLLGLGAWLYSQQSAVHPLPIAEGDTIASWDWQGTHKDGGELEKRARDEITRSEELLGGDQSGENDDPTDYILYVSIANQYELLGEGKAAYDSLGKALTIDSTRTGLAWRNLGNLLERLGALNTARIAYAHAVEAQGQVSEYHVARLTFLMKYFAKDTAAIDAAFEEAEKGLGGNPPEILQLKAQWNEKKGNIDKAIEALREMEKVMGGNDPSARSEIARLRNL